MSGHKHADLMLEYAKDALTNENPWKLWELRLDGSYEWSVLHANPEWRSDFEYRRKPVKWSPVGGGWRVINNNSINNYISNKGSKEFGLHRPTKEQAERALIEMRRFNRLLALRDELCGDETFDSWNCEDNNIPKYYLNFNHYNYDKMIWDFEINYYVNYIGICFSSAETAKRACEMLNSGQVEL
jgi:hypothetical protein